MEGILCRFYLKKGYYHCEVCGTVCICSYPLLYLYCLMELCKRCIWVLAFGL